jgi:hypothetical protein
MVLKNIILMLKLGTNLLSARHLYKASLVRSINLEMMYITLYKTIFLKVTKKNSLYIINYVSTYYRDTIFSYVNYKINDSSKK